MTDRMRALEEAEINAFADLYRAASPEVIAAAGLAITPVGDGVLLTANRFDVLALNRLVGFGLHTVPTEAVLAEAIEEIAAAGVPRAVVQVAPVDGHEALGAALERHGLRPYNNWMRLSRDLRSIDDLPSPSPDLVVREIGRADAAAFAHIVATAFGYPPTLAPMVEQVIGRRHWHHYMAFVGDMPIAAAAMFVNGDAAWFGFAATDAAYRRRGAQQALVAWRLRDAESAGARWISVETAEDTILRDAPSFRNLRRLGFEVAYKRANYLWTASSAA